MALIDFSHAYLEAAYRGVDVCHQLRAVAAVASHLHVHNFFGRTGVYVIRLLLRKTLRWVLGT